MPPIKLCPHPGVVFRPPWVESIPERYVASNQYFYQEVERREQELGTLELIVDAQYHRLAPQSLPLGIPVALYSSIQAREFSPPALVPLNECILAIAWEFNDRSPAPDICQILENKSLESLVTLLRSAAIYQSKLESVIHSRSL